MATNIRKIQASPEQVWAVLANGWLYPLWVVGASRMREVDPDWPAVGSLLHHSVGSWPLLLDDTTEVVESKPHSLLVLHARAWPTGKAQVSLQLEAVGSDTEVTMEEDVISGPARALPKPVRDLQLSWRNAESLRRLGYVAERRSAGSTSAS